MKVVLVTGLIGSGKTAACRYLESLGFPVYDSDSRTKALYSSVPGLIQKVEDAIGVPFAEVKIIFSDPVKRKALEKVVYPYVLEDFGRWKAEQTAPVVLFESAVAQDKPQFDGQFDAVLEIWAPAEVRIGRNPAAAQRDNAQARVAHADWTIENDGDKASLYKKIDRIIPDLKKVA